MAFFRKPTLTQPGYYVHFKGLLRPLGEMNLFKKKTQSDPIRIHHVWYISFLLLDFEGGKCRSKYHHTWSFMALGHQPFASCLSTQFCVFKDSYPSPGMNHRPRICPLLFLFAPEEFGKLMKYWKVNGWNPNMELDGR